MNKLAPKINESSLADYFRSQPDVEFAVLFGSMASGRSTPMSDIDIAVYFTNRDDRLKLADRQLDITCAVMEMTHCDRIDIVILNGANPFLSFQVVKNGRLLHARDERFFYGFKASAFGRYQDIKPMYDYYFKITEEKLRRGLHG